MLSLRPDGLGHNKCPVLIKDIKERGKNKGCFAGCRQALVTLPTMMPVPGYIQTLMNNTCWARKKMSKFLVSRCTHVRILIICMYCVTEYRCFM